MTTRERLLALKKWATDNLCQGKMLKAPGKDVTLDTYQEPRVYLAWPPSRGNQTGWGQPDPVNVAPGILIAPGTLYAKKPETDSNDLYKKLHRPEELGEAQSFSLLFIVYEPGVRLPGFEDAAKKGMLDISKLEESTEEGLFTLTDWMDECKKKLMTSGGIPGTDMYLMARYLTAEPYSEGGYISDKRPYYYGFVSATFGGYSEKGAFSPVDELLL